MKTPVLGAVFETVPFNRSGTSPLGANSFGHALLPNRTSLRQRPALRPPSVGNGVRSFLIQVLDQRSGLRLHRHRIFATGKSELRVDPLPVFIHVEDGCGRWREEWTVAPSSCSEASDRQQPVGWIPRAFQRLHRFNGDSSAILSKSRSVVRSLSLWRMQSWAMRASIVPTWRPRRRQRFLRLAAST